LREKAQLTRRTSAFALQAGTRQAGLCHGPLGEFVTNRDDLVRDGFEEDRTRLGSGLAKRDRGGVRQRASALDLRHVRYGEARLQNLASRRIDGRMAGACLNFFPADEDGAGNHVGVLLRVQSAKCDWQRRDTQTHAA
jgi:hypothetical protein